MKYIYRLPVIFFFILFCSSGYGQGGGNGISSPAWSDSLDGEWKGYFSYDKNYLTSYPIKLYFRKEANGSYSVFSYSRDRDTIVVAAVDYRFSGTNSVYLVETKQLKPKRTTFNCFQSMSLKLIRTDGQLKMEGTWATVTENGCNPAEGPITFTRKSSPVTKP